ncbi:MAG TPA: hypothetical protein VGI98_01185 [Candidatus Limnocylindrales bacterium]
MGAAPAEPGPAEPLPDGRGTDAREPAGRQSGLDGAPDRAFLVAASLAGMAAIAAACLVLHVLALNGTYGKLTDALFITPFWSDASLVHAGFVPYHDFGLEYPPLSLPVFVLPAILPGGGLDYPSYRTMFEVLMALCAVGLVPITAWTIARLGGRRVDVLLGIGFLAVTPLLLGPLTLSRYDLWPALLTAAATLAMVSSRPRLAFALLALGALAKVYPVFLAPIFAWYAWRTAGRREAVIALAIGAAIGIAGLAPFLAIDPSGAIGPFIRSVARPLQIESLGASILVVLHGWLGLHVGPVTYAFDSYNLVGPYTDELSSIESGVLLGGLIVVTLGAAMGAAQPDRFVLAVAAALALTVAFGKVLSPQYAVWLVAAVAACASLAARPLLGIGVVLVLTQVYFPARYERYLAGDLSPAIIVLERNLVLAAVAIYLVAATWMRIRPPARPPRPDPPVDPAPAAA